VASLTQLTAPGGAPINGPILPARHDLDWWVNGTAYTTSDTVVEFATRRGYTTASAASVPAAYTAAVASMRDEAARTSYHGTRLQDANDPDARTYYSQDVTA